MRTLVLLLLTFLSIGSSAQTAATVSNVVRFDASAVLPAAPVDLPMGGTSPSGHRIGINSRYLVLDGKPWLPVMGEFHFSRYPEQYWEEELLKMKAGGVQIVATYLFWIHHEEVKGEFVWSGNRDIRRFIELCKKHGLYVFIRIGPYSHGEVRNGGLPDWILAAGPTRKNDPNYLAEVGNYFRQIGRQIKGLRWQDDGPIIGVQLENEYYAHGPEAGAAHISELKRIALESGIEAPLYTVTGWGGPDFPPNEVVPVFGGYPDNFWESSLSDQEPSGFYLFDVRRDNGEMGGNEGATASESGLRDYPFLMAEAGGGMQVAYHRRPVISGDDVSAIAVTRLGSGANLYGYYMYQGGTNPQGKLTTLNESEASDHVYDLPVLSYDFQAPLGEFGQMRPSFRETKKIHLFLETFGSELAQMSSVAPATVVTGPADFTQVRAAARVRGDRGFLFVNNYVRGYRTPDHRDVQFEIKHLSGTTRFPSKPITIPSGEYFIWPVHMEMEGALLEYATAQPLTKIQERNDTFYFFFAQRGIPTEFAFRRKTVRSFQLASNATASRDGSRLIISNIVPGTKAAATLRSRAGRTVHIVVLTSQQASDLWSISLANRKALILSPADVFSDGLQVHLRARDRGKLKFADFPNNHLSGAGGAALEATGADGIFTGHKFAVSQKTINVRSAKSRESSETGPGREGKYNAIAPLEADFQKAAAWKLEVPDGISTGLSDVFLRIRYKGDIARLYDGSTLLADDFYKGTEWEVGLKRFEAKSAGLQFELKIFPLRKDAHIYMPREAWPSFPPDGQLADVIEVSAVPEYEAVVVVKPGTK